MERGPSRASFGRRSGTPYLRRVIPSDMSREPFKSPQSGDPDVLNTTWAICKSHSDQPVTNDIVKARPPYFHHERLEDDQVNDVFKTHFPGLPDREHYGRNDLPRRLRHSRFVLSIYDLEGCLRRNEQLRFDLLLAGIFHYAQSLHQMIWVCDVPIKCPGDSNEKAQAPTHVPSMLSKRLWFFIVDDQALRQYSLAWFDLKDGTIWYADSLRDDAPTPRITLDLVRRSIHRMARGREYDGPIAEVPTRASVTHRPDAKSDGALYVLENFRMRVLEPPEDDTSTQCPSGLQDWTGALHLRHPATKTDVNPNEAMLQRHLYAFRLELSAFPGRVRWPERPTVPREPCFQYLDSRPPIRFRSNAACLPDSSITLAALPPEPIYATGHRSTSLLRSGSQNAAFAPGTSKQSLAPMPQRASPEGTVGRPASRSQGLDAAPVPPLQLYPPTARPKAALRRHDLFGELFDGVPGDDCPSGMSSPQQRAPASQARRDLTPSLQDPGAARASNDARRPFTRLEARRQAAEADEERRATAELRHGPYRPINFYIPIPSRKVEESQPSQRAGTPPIQAAARAGQAMGQEHGPQRYPAPARGSHDVPGGLSYRNDMGRGGRRPMPVRVPDSIESPHTSLWANEPSGTQFRPTHGVNWRGFAFAKANEHNERAIEQAQSANANRPIQR